MIHTVKMFLFAMCKNPKTTSTKNFYENIGRRNVKMTTSKCKYNIKVMFQ
jgi:hypothetical protein